jgi:hypothetical protein
LQYIKIIVYESPISRLSGIMFFIYYNINGGSTIAKQWIFKDFGEEK